MKSSITSKQVSIIIPALNEENSIYEVVNKLTYKLPEAEIIVIDDGSTDKTYDSIKDLNIKIIQHPLCLGYGTSLRSGIEVATKNYVLFCDADGQHRVRDVVALIDNIGKYDMTVGYRRKDSHIQLNRLLGKSIFKWFSNLIIGEKIRDINSGLRIIKKSKIKKYLHLMPHGFSFSTTCTFAFLKDNRSINWIPIVTKKRNGVSSVRQFKDGPSALLQLIRLSILFEPLRIFLFSSTSLLFLAFISFLVNTYLEQALNVTDTTVILALGSLIVFLSGLLCEQVSGLRRDIK